MNQETPVGKFPKHIMPDDISLTLNGAGKIDVRFFGKILGPGDSLAGGENASLLTATLYELVRACFPEVELIDAGPGLVALKSKADSLTELLNQVQADCQKVAIEKAELAQKLAEAEAANEALTEQMSRLAMHVASLENAYDSATAENTALREANMGLNVRVDELERLATERAAEQTPLKGPRTWARK